MFRLLIIPCFLIGYLLCPLTGLAQGALQRIEYQLLQIYDRDQGVRKQLSQLDPSTEEWKDLLVQMRADDAFHQEYVADLLDGFGWPVSLHYKAHMAIFLVIDHAPLEFQQKYVEKVREQEQKDLLDASLCVGLYDRIRMRMGQPQEYGTQTFSIPSTRQIYLWPVADPEGLNERRQTVDLEPIEEYLENFPGIIWDKKMTARQADKLRKQQ